MSAIKCALTEHRCECCRCSTIVPQIRGGWRCRPRRELVYLRLKLAAASLDRFQLARHCMRINVDGLYMVVVRLTLKLALC